MYHNHVDKDYSHPWYTEERYNREDEGLARIFHHPIIRTLFPFFAWHFYLMGFYLLSFYFVLYLVSNINILILIFYTK
jgi:hypothetical protein